MYSRDTQTIHGGREDFGTLGVHAAPIDLSTTYPINDLEGERDNLLAMAHGEAPRGGSVYARLHNPTVARFESAMALLERGDDAVAFASGMATLTAILLAAKAKGGHVVAIRPLYGGSDHLLTSELLGLPVSFVEPHEVASALRPDTSLIVLETVANPTLRLTSVREVVRQAGTVPVLVDSTFATPILQSPLELGATMVMHSATKYIGGHGDAMGGIVAGAADWMKDVRAIRAATGAVLHPQAAYTLHRGLQTLGARVRVAQANATQLAFQLRDNPFIESVYFPGFRDCDPGRLVGEELRGPGAMLGFTVRGGFTAASAIMKFVRLCTPAVSLGSTDTLIQHPAALTHGVVAEDVKEALGISPGFLRISVGLEDPRDLIDDLEQALEKAHQIQAALDSESRVA